MCKVIKEENKEIGTIIKTYTMKRNTNTSTKYDVIVIWYRDKYGKKRVKLYDRPLVDYYIIKDKNSEEANHPPLYISKDKVEKHSAYSDILLRDIAVKTNSMSFYDKYAFNNGPNCNELKNLYRHNHVYSGDIDLTDYCIMDFQKTHKPDMSYELHKCFFDIEVDTMHEGFVLNKNGGYGYPTFPHEEEGPCPINVITLIDGKTKICYAFLLRNKLNDSMLEFEKNELKFKQELLQKVKENHNFEAPGISFKYFDEELDLLKAFMEKTHEIDPDYMLAWNMKFDVDTIVSRLKRLLKVKVKAECEPKTGSYVINGLVDRESSEILTDRKYWYMENTLGNRIEIPKRNYYSSELKRKDDFRKKKKGNDKRIDVFQVLDGINWMDQLLYYRANHDSSGKKSQYTLDYIAYLELNDSKVRMVNDETIKNLSWLDYNKFMYYSIWDSYLLFKLEDKLLDIDVVQRLSEILNTRKEKVFNNSISVANLFRVFAEDNNIIMNANKNMKYNKYGFDEKVDTDASLIFDNMYRTAREIAEEDQKYKNLFGVRDRLGALVLDPNLMERVGTEIFPNFKAKFIHRLVVDFDLKSLYPSILIAFNISPNYLVGKFYLEDDTIKTHLKKEHNMIGCFKVSDKSDDVEIEEEEEEFYDDETDTLEIETSKIAEMNDLGPTLVDSIIAQDWCSLYNKFMFGPKIEDIFEDLDRLIYERDNN